MSDLKPINGHVLVQVLKDDTTTQSGFALPESSQEKPQKGEILAGEDINVNFRKGDIIVFRRYKGVELKENGKDLIFVKYEDIVGHYG